MRTHGARSTSLTTTSMTSHWRTIRCSGCGTQSPCLTSPTARRRSFSCLDSRDPSECEDEHVHVRTHAHSRRVCTHHDTHSFPSSLSLSLFPSAPSPTVLRGVFQHGSGISTTMTRSRSRSTSYLQLICLVSRGISRGFTTRLTVRRTFRPSTFLSQSRFSERCAMRTIVLSPGLTTKSVPS
jgi:hypothetical protein